MSVQGIGFRAHGPLEWDLQHGPKDALRNDLYRRLNERILYEVMLRSFRKGFGPLVWALSRFNIRGGYVLRSSDSAHILSVLKFQLRLSGNPTEEGLVSNCFCIIICGPLLAQG